MKNETIQQTTDLAAAFVSNNQVRPDDVPGLIASIHAALLSLSQPEAPAADKPKPAVSLPWKKTIKPEHLISLVDGKPYRTLRRHLSRHGLTPDGYRQRYDLPHDYPMVSPAYSEKRSALARAAGLGAKRKTDAAAAAPEPVEVEPAKEAPGKPKRGRPKKKAEAT